MKVIPILFSFGALVATGQAASQRYTREHDREQRPIHSVALKSAAPKAAIKACYPGSEPGLSCEGLTASAAVQQARAADDQTAQIWWQFGVGVLTFAAAVVAAGFAGAAARHTKRSADISRDASRAWVVCDDILFRQPLTFKHEASLGQRYWIDVDVVLKNVGSGLARNVRVNVEIVSSQSVVFEPAWASIRERTHERFQAHAMPDRILAMPIAPSQVIPQRFGWEGPHSNLPSMEQVIGGSFYFIGYLDYQDHFGRHQSARFAFHPDGDSVRAWDRMTLVRAGNIGDAS